MNLLVSLSLGDAVPSSFTTVQVQKIGVPRQLSENSRKFQSWIAVLQIAFLNGPNPTLRECRFLHRVTADGELDWARSTRPSRPKLPGKFIGSAAPLDCMCTRPDKPPFRTRRPHVECLPRVDYARLRRVGILEYLRWQSQDVTDCAEANSKDHPSLRMHKRGPSPQYPSAFLGQSLV